MAGRWNRSVRLGLVVALALPAASATAWSEPVGPPAAPVVSPTGALGSKDDDAPPTDQLIVRFDSDAPRSLRALNAAAAAPVDLVRRLDDGAWVVRLPDRRSQAAVEALADQWERRGDVVSAEADALMLPTAVPNDPMYVNQWHYVDPVAQPTKQGANLPGAWDITTGSTDVVVAVLDTGKLDHVDLAGRFAPGYDMISSSAIANDGNGRDADASDPGDWITSVESTNQLGSFYGCRVADSSWHGTHVAGTIGAASNNGIGVAGINWTSKIVPVRVLGKCGGYTSDIADGIRWAAGVPVSGVPVNANPADVLNLSLGGSGACSFTYQNAINAAVAAGAVVVVAAGNSNVDASLTQPANCAGVITVAASNRPGGRSYYSNFGASVEIAAPGGASGTDPMVLSTLNAGTTVPATDSYANYQGTSMAAPHVAGIVSLMKSVNPNLTLSETLALLQSTATAFPAGSTCNTSLCGSGIVNAAAAVSAADAAFVPANDDFADAILFSVGVDSPLGGTNLNATKQPGEPDHGIDGGAHSVWWRFTTSVSGTLTMDTTGSGFDTQLAVYTGSTVDGLSVVGSNDDCAEAPLESCLTLGLAASTTYHVAVDGRGGSFGPLSVRHSWVPDAAPGAPTAVTGTPGTSQITVSWTAPASDGGSPITGYTATAAPGGATCATSTTSCSITGLTNGIAHTVTVTGTNAIGTGPPSAPSASVTPQTVPGAPTAVAGTPGNSQVGVAWLAPDSNGGSAITGYTVTASPGAATCVTTALGCMVGGLTNGIAYTFTVVANTVVGDGPASAASATVRPTVCSASGFVGPFSDVLPNHPFCRDIEWMAVTGVAGGYADGTYRPSNDVTRQAIASFLYREAGSPPVAAAASTFADVPPTHQFFTSIQWLAQEGLSVGSPNPADGKPLFKPTDVVTRQAMAQFLWRRAGSPASLPTPAFADVPSTHPFFDAIQWMAHTGLATGTPDAPGLPLYKPSGAVSRQAAASFLYRADAQL